MRIYHSRCRSIALQIVFNRSTLGAWLKRFWYLAEIPKVQNKYTFIVTFGKSVVFIQTARTKRVRVKILTLTLSLTLYPPVYLYVTLKREGVRVKSPKKNFITSS